MANTLGKSEFDRLPGESDNDYVKRQIAISSGAGYTNENSAKYFAQGTPASAAVMAASSGAEQRASNNPGRSGDVPQLRAAQESTWIKDAFGNMVKRWVPGANKPAPETGVVVPEYVNPLWNMESDDTVTPPPQSGAVVDAPAMEVKAPAANPVDVVTPKTFTPPNYFNPATASGVEVPPPAYNPNAGTGVFVQGVERTRGEMDALRGRLSNPTGNNAIFADISGKNVTVGSTARGDVAFGRGQGGVAAAPTQSIMSGTWKRPPPTASGTATPSPITGNVTTEGTASPISAGMSAQQVSSAKPIYDEINQIRRELSQKDVDTTGMIGQGQGSRNGIQVGRRERGQIAANNRALKEMRLTELTKMLPEAIKADQTYAMDQQKFGLEQSKANETARSNRATENGKMIDAAVKVWEAAGRTKAETDKYRRDQKDAAAKRDEERRYNEQQKAAEIARGDTQKAKEWDLKIYELDQKEFDDKMKQMPVAIGPNGTPMKQNARGGWEPITSADGFQGYDFLAKKWTDPELYKAIADQQAKLEQEAKTLEQRRATLRGANKPANTSGGGYSQFYNDK